MADIVNKAKTEVSVDGQKAADELKVLESLACKYKDQMIAAQKSGDIKGIDKARADLKKLNTDMRKILRSSYDVDKVLSNLSAAGPRQLSNTLKQLNKDLNSGRIARGTQEWDAYQKKIRLVNAELQKIKNEHKAMYSTSQRFFGLFRNGFTGVLGFMASITGISYGITKISEDVSKLDDTYSDVMKTTGLTKEEVVALNEALKKIDTRTAREELNKIAEEGGRIGIANEDILDFVRVMDIANVALGDSFKGGAEEIANVLGKLKFLFDETKAMGVDQAYLSIGSAINELGANGVASEANIANFATRVGSLPSSLKPSIASTLALGAAFEESGIEAEISARAYNIFLKQASTNGSKFAKVMNMTTSEVEKLINTDPLNFFLVFAERMRGLSATDVSKTLHELGINADGANKAIGAAANNTERFKELIDLSNKSFSEGTSVLNEFNIKNTNLAAQWDKSKKVLKEVALDLGSKLNPALLESSNIFNFTIKSIPILVDWLVKYKGVIGTLAASLIYYYTSLKIVSGAQSAYNTIATTTRLLSLANAEAKALETGNTARAAAAQRLHTAAMREGGIATRAYISLTSLLSAAKLVLTGRFSEARKMVKSFVSSLPINPWALGVTAFMALATAIGYVIYKYSQLMTATKAIKEVSGQYNEELAKEKMHVDKLFTAYNKTNPESAEHKKIKDQIISQYGSYLKGLITEKGEITSISYAYEAVNTKIREQIMLKIKNAATEKIVVDSIRNQQDGMDSVIKNVTKQLHLSDEVANNTREKINKIITSFTAEEGWEKNKSELGKRIKEYLGQVAGIQSDFSLQYKTGFWEPKSLNMEVESLTSGLYRSQLEINKVSNQYKGLISQASELKSIMNPDQDNSPDSDITVPQGDDKKSEKAAMERKKVNSELIILEKEFNRELTKIKEQYLDGSITSEAEHAQKIASLQNKYDDDRKDKLANLLKQVKDSTVREEMDKQISEIELKRIDRELALKSKLEKIILDADPAMAERKNYEARLRELDLFDDDATKRTKEQQEVFELLEKQHQERMSKIIKPEVAKKLKIIDEQLAAEEQKLADRFAQGLKSEQQYKSELVLLEIAFAAKRLEIDGLTEEQLINFRKQSSEKQTQLLENNAELRSKIEKKKRIESLKESRDQELAFLDQLLSDDLENRELYEQTRLAIIEKYELLEEVQNKEKFQRMLDNAQFYLDSIQQLMGAYAAYSQASNEAEVSAINRKYDSQIKAAGNNSRRVKKIEEQRDAEIKNINKQAEERSFKIQIAMAMASTFQSAINAYSSTAAIPVVGPALAPIAAGVATVAGLTTVAAINKQHKAAMANYWEGGYTPNGNKFDAAGIVHRGEFVGNQQAVNNPTVRRIFDVVDLAQKNNTVSSLSSRDFATALEYREKVASRASNPPEVRSAMQSDKSNETLLYVLSEISETNQRLNDRLDSPFETVNTVTGNRGIEQALTLHQRMIKNKSRS